MVRLEQVESLAKREVNQRLGGSLPDLFSGWPEVRFAYRYSLLKPSVILGRGFACFEMLDVPLRFA